MSSYIDHHDTQCVNRTREDGRSYSVIEGFVTHSWEDFTKDRLCWLYGPAFAAERSAQTQADIAAWNRLGNREAA